METTRSCRLIVGGLFALGISANWLLGCGRQSPAQTTQTARSSAAAFRPAPPKPAGSKTMVQRLAEIARDMNPEEFPFYNHQRAAILRTKLAREADPLTKVSLQKKYVAELLNAGESAQAITEIVKLDHMMQKDDPMSYIDGKATLQLQQAIAYLRLGEQQNCLNNHNAESCLVPIHGGGVHKIQYGARQAIKVLLTELRQNPNDLTGRWLLNIAYMTVGEYPHHVPPRWLIPPKAFQSDYDIKRFPNVAGDAGLDTQGLAGGAIMEDFDNDGYLDIMCSSKGLHSQLQYFHSNGDGTFTERTKEAGLTGELGGLNIECADYNNDGYQDVIVLRGSWFGKQGHHPLSLLRNNGNGTFTDVTEQAGLLRFHPTETAAWFDYNGDGLLDLFVGNESVPFIPDEPLLEDRNPCELFRNNGDGTFTECAHECGLDKLGYVKCVTSGDYNNDGRPDLYISFLREPNILFRNDGPDPSDKSPHPRWKFTDVSRAAGVDQPIKSFPAFFFDYDNDGWQDLFVCGYDFHYVDVPDMSDVVLDYLGHPNAGAEPRLYHNNHNGTFTDVTKAAHLDKVLHAMAANYGDLDNDGYLDFYLGTGDVNLASLMPNRMFRNAGGKFFQDVTTSGGFGHLQKGHGIAIGDIDNDGDQDIYEDMGGSYEGDTAFNTLYENPGHGNHWLKVRLEGVKTNRSGIGARIHVTVRTPTGLRSIYRAVSAGSGFGNLPVRQEIGLGNAIAIDSVEIFWPVTQQSQSFRGLQLDHYYKIREGQAPPQLMPLKSFKIRHRAGQMHDMSHLENMGHSMPSMPGMSGHTM